MADTQDILNVPIYINGGDGNPSTKLEERELYLDLTSARLYCGGVHSADYTPIRAGYSDCLLNSKINICASFEDRSSIFALGSMYYDFSNNRFTGATPGAYSVDGAKLTNINKLVLSSNCYGDTLPSSGEQGQLFFKIG